MYEDTFSGMSTTKIPILTSVWRYDIRLTQKSKMTAIRMRGMGFAIYTLYKEGENNTCKL